MRLVDIEPLFDKYDKMNEGTEFSPIHFMNDLAALPVVESCEDCIRREDVVRILDWSKASVQMLDDYSADELVGEIITIEKEVENLLSVKPQTVTDFADKCKECGKILNETYQQKWIPVSERLPKSLEDVLATDGVDMFVAFVREKTKGKYEWYSLDVNYDKNTPIEAWMPLPQPYKEGSNGE